MIRRCDSFSFSLHVYLWYIYYNRSSLFLLQISDFTSTQLYGFIIISIYITGSVSFVTIFFTHS